jgi:DNA recombination protein RmuC
MGTGESFYLLAALTVGAFISLGVTQLVRRMVGDRSTFQNRIQSEQIQKQDREMREQAKRLEELEAERIRTETLQAQQAAGQTAEIEQLTAIRNQIAEKLELMTRSAGSQGQAALVEATEQLLREHQRTEHERQERERIERERLERERTEREQADRARAEQERAERERWLRERDQRDQAERERWERERAERDQADRERVVREERERAERDQAERARWEAERAEREKADRERAERDRADRERWERERAERDQADRERVARVERERAERLAREERESAERASGAVVQPAPVDHSRNEAAIRSLIEPITATLSRFDQKLAAIEDNRRQSLGAIVQHLEQVARVHADVRDETRRLARALESSPKGFGPWGEHQLRNILDLAGMAPYIDIVPTDPARTGQVTDTVLRLPGDRRLVIDRSVPTETYMAAVSAKDPAEEDRALTEHAAIVRRHLERLGSESYRQGFDPRPELTVMFLPAENLLGAALAKDPALFEDGVRRQVLMATPSTLVALAKSIAHSWEQEKSLDNVRELASIGAELLDRMGSIGEQVDELGRGLEASVRSYNSFVGDLQNSVMGHLRRLRELAPGARKRELREPQQVDVSVRAPRRRRSFVITQAGQEAAAAIVTRTPEGPPIPMPARAMSPADIAVVPAAPEPPRQPAATPVEPF